MINKKFEYFNFLRLSKKHFSSVFENDRELEKIHTEKRRKTEKILYSIKENEKTRLKNFGEKNYNEYKIVLEKAIYSYDSIKFSRNRKKYMFYFAIIATCWVGLKMIYLYYWLYYMFNYDVDISKPKVSDYILERFK